MGLTVTLTCSCNITMIVAFIPTSISLNIKLAWFMQVYVSHMKTHLAYDFLLYFPHKLFMSLS